MRYSRSSSPGQCFCLNGTEPSSPLMPIIFMYCPRVSALLNLDQSTGLRPAVFVIQALPAASRFSERCHSMVRKTPKDLVTRIISLSHHSLRDFEDAHPHLQRQDSE